eukprot:354219-Chlamydomonas_euryale.AAC.1
MKLRLGRPAGLGPHLLLPHRSRPPSHCCACAVCPVPSRAPHYGFHTPGLLGTYHAPGSRTMSLAGDTNSALTSGASTLSMSGTPSEPMHTMVDPEPVMKTAEKAAPPPAACRSDLSLASSGRLCESRGWGGGRFISEIR